MSDAQPQRARRAPRRRGDHQLVVRTHVDQPTNMSLLAEALLLHATEQRAKAEGSPTPHLAGMQKLADRRRGTREEGADE